MAIDPANRAPAPGAIALPEASEIDPGSLVQLLSMQQTEVLRNALINSVPKAADLAELFSRVSAVGAKLSAANNVVRDRELNAVDQTAQSLSSVPTHERDGVEVSPADNDRFQQIDDWAKDRDLDLQPMTKVIPPPTKDEIEQARRDAAKDYLEKSRDSVELEKKAARSASLKESEGSIEQAKSEARAASLEESQPKIEAAKEEARKQARAKAKEDGLDEDATKKLVGLGVDKATRIATTQAESDADESARVAEQKARGEAESAAAAAEQKVEEAARKRAEAAGQAVADEMAKTKPKTVVDVDSVSANQQKVAAYRKTVEDGTADNPALRASVKAAVGELGIGKELKELGVTGPLNTLSDLQTQAQGMLNWAVSIVNQLTEQLNTLENDAADCCEKLAGLDSVGEFAEQTQKDLEKAKELHDALEKAIERLDELKRGDAAETAEQVREALEDLSGVVRHAADVAQNLSDTRDHTSQVVSGLSETDQAALRDQLERWLADRRKPAS